MVKSKAIFSLFFAIILASCGGGGDAPTSAQQTTTKVGETTIVEAVISRTTGGEITLPDGEKLEIPAWALKEDLKISVKKEGQTYKFEPAGLIVNQELTFKIPVGNDLRSQAIGKHVVGYLYSDQSLTITTNSGKINADRLLMVDGDALASTQELSVPLRHFSIFRLSIQDRIYIPFELPAKYLQKGDIVFALSHENYQFCATCSDFYTITPESQFSFDWFPGHAAVIASTKDDLPCGQESMSKDCNILESTPPRVRVSNLSRDFISPTGHLFMGARRPKEFTITSSEGESIFNWANAQVGKQWTFLNDKAVFTGDDYSAFSCVGLVEASYKRGIGKGIINDSWRWLQDDGYVRPLDMYDRTKPVDEINVRSGERVSFKVNAVFLSQDKKQYFDLRSKEKAGSEFLLSAFGLPAGSVFNQETGEFSWDIPSTHEGGAVKITFSVRNSWPKGFISPAIAETKYEYMKINIQKQLIGSPPTITTHTLAPASGPTPIIFRASFDVDMAPIYSTTGGYVPKVGKEGYWPDLRTFEMQLDSYTPGATITLLASGFRSAAGVYMAADKAFTFPTSVVQTPAQGTFTVAANNEAGTTFIAPSSVSSCTFTATGSWMENPTTPPYGATGIVTRLIVPGTKLNTILGRLIAFKQSAYVDVGASQTLNISTPNESLTFLMNDLPGSYVGNVGTLTVNYTCQ